jgi:broad specificity phosphatase PhoE
MNRMLLIRHGACDPVGVYLAGRSSGVHLNERGRFEVERLAERLAGSGAARVFTGPLERARETADPVALALGAPVEVQEGLNEIDFGAWTGKYFEQLSTDPVWHRFNTLRAATPIPGGETIGQVQTRVVETLLDAANRYPDSCLAFVGHADPIRTAIAYFAGIPLDLMLRIRVDTGSVSVIDIDDFSMAVSALNVTERTIKDWQG